MENYKPELYLFFKTVVTWGVFIPESYFIDLLQYCNALYFMS